VEGCLAPQHRPRVEPFDRVVFLDYPTDITRDAEAIHVRVVCLAGALITIRGAAAGRLESELRSSSAIRLPARNVPALLYYLLNLNDDENVTASLQLRDEVDGLTDRMSGDPDSVTMEGIQSLKRRVGSLASRYEDQLYCITLLLQIRTDAFQLASVREYFGDLVNRIHYLQQMMERLGSQLEDLRNQFVAGLQGRANRKLNVLTIVQAVFVPLTLITGMYGMNFDSMPALHWPHAYFICLGIMASIVVGELWLFYRRGWFN
jgi:magnesium/cobalt transport protein CorA